MQLLFGGMPLVCIDSNVVDLFLEAMAPDNIGDFSEAQESPPPFDDSRPEYRREILACYWLLAMAKDWSGVIFTFSDILYLELKSAPEASRLLGLAIEIREFHDEIARVVDPTRLPRMEEVMAVGLREEDATHIADAIALGCNVFLTNDRRVRNKSIALEARWSLACRRPSEYLIEAVRGQGAPWTARAPWPWDELDGA